MQTLADRHVSKHHIERILYLPEPDRVDDIQGTHDDSKAADQYGNAVCPGERTEQQQKTENGKDQTDKKDEHPALPPQAQRYCAQHLDHAGKEQPAADEEWQRDKGEQGIEQEKDTEKKVQDTFGLKPVAFPGAHGAHDDHREQQTAVQQKTHAGELGQLHIAAQRIEEGEDTDTQEDNTGYEYQAPGSNVFGRGSHRAIYGKKSVLYSRDTTHCGTVGVRNRWKICQKKNSKNLHFLEKLYMFVLPQGIQYSSQKSPRDK